MKLTEKIKPVYFYYSYSPLNAGLNALNIQTIPVIDMNKCFRLTNLQMEHAVPDESLNNPALTVEQCLCPLGYQGSSCQVSLFTSISIKNFINLV